MNVTSLKVTIKITSSYSLKDKRRVIKSLIQRIHNKYNVSISEVGDNDLLNQAVIGMSIVSNKYVLNQQTIQNIIDFIEDYYPVEIINIEDY